MAEEDDMDNVDEIVDELIDLVDENDHEGEPNVENEENEAVGDQQILGLDADEFHEIFRKQWVRGILFMFLETGYHPLATSRHLVYLGYEPFQLFKSKKHLFGSSGPEVFCRPSIFYYTLYLYQKHGVKVLYLGLDPYILGLFIERFFVFCVHKYIDFHYPELGGNPIIINDDTKEIDLTDMQSFRKRLRYFIRSITVSTTSMIIVYPFTVMTMRHVAQFIHQQSYGAPFKYAHLFTTVMKIGNEEGPKGFYGGLVPAILGNFIYSAGFATSMFLLARTIARIKQAYRMKKDSLETKIVDVFGDLVKISAKFALIHLTMPMKLVSWCMALSGSGVSIPTLPYYENNESWQDVYGAIKSLSWLPTIRRMFHRTYTGPVREQVVFNGVRYYVANNDFWVSPVEESFHRRLWKKVVNSLF